MKIWIALCLLLIAGVGFAQELVISPALEESIEQIEDETRQIRQLEELSTVGLNFPSREDIAAYVEEAFSEATEEFDPEDERLFYVALGLIPPDVDLLQLYIDLYSQQIAGFYDAETKEMNVVLISATELGETLPVGEAIIYAHEYTHALQDQHFDLLTLINTLQEIEEPDRILAMQSLYEGDATYVMTQYMTALIQNDPGVVGQILALGNVGGPALPENMPKILQDELLFPYLSGLNFITGLIGDGGWERVDEAFSAPPQSTEQIYHPERYLAGDAPVEVTSPDQSADLGAGWRLVHDVPLGEFYLRQFLARGLGANNVIRAATGWGGDRFHVYTEDSGGAFAWTLNTVWDTPQDASEFYVEAQAFGAQLFGAVIDSACWSNNTEAFCVVPNGDSGVILSLGPNLETASMLMQGVLGGG